MFVYGDAGSLCSNLAGIDSEKLYRATFICQYGLFCCMALASFRLFCKNLGNLQEFFGQMNYRPPWQKIARTPMIILQVSFCVISSKIVSFSIYVVVNSLSQVIFVFLLFLGMVMYANDIETKEN